MSKAPAKSQDQTAVANVIDTVINFPVFNFFLDILSALVRHWKITLSALVVLYLFYRLAERRK